MDNLWVRGHRIRDTVPADNDDIDYKVGDTVICIASRAAPPYYPEEGRAYYIQGALYKVVRIYGTGVRLVETTTTASDFRNGWYAHAFELYIPEQYKMLKVVNAHRQKWGQPLLGAEDCEEMIREEYFEVKAIDVG